MNEKKKKLLILGANPETVPLVQCAEALGVHTIVTDHVPGAYAKHFASESKDINGFDVDALAKLVREENIDGIMVGVADRLIAPYQQLCEQVGLPCYATKEQCLVLTNKEKFNNCLEEHGLQGIPHYKVDITTPMEELETISFPVMVKPVDSNSGKGMSLCYNAKELVVAMKEALKYSLSQNFLVERYMTSDDAYISFSFIDGICYPTVIADRFTFKQKGVSGAVCMGAILPSGYANLYMEQEHAKMCKIFQGLRIKNGVLMVSAFIENNNFYYYDPGFRLQGEQPNLSVKEMTGFNQLEQLIRFALSEKIKDNTLVSIKDCRSWRNDCATLWILLKEGKIEEISGLEKIEQRPDVYAIIKRMKLGDEVHPEMIGTEAQVFARLYLKGETKESLHQSISEIQEILCIRGKNGISLVQNKFTI